MGISFIWGRRGFHWIPEGVWTQGLQESEQNRQSRVLSSQRRIQTCWEDSKRWTWKIYYKEDPGEKKQKVFHQWAWIASE